MKKPDQNILQLSAKLRAFADSDTIFVAGGLPNPDLFPFTKLEVKLSSCDDEDSSQNLVVEGDKLKAALQYLPTLG